MITITISDLSNHGAVVVVGAKKKKKNVFMHCHHKLSEQDV